MGIILGPSNVATRAEKEKYSKKELNEEYKKEPDKEMNDIIYANEIKLECIKNQIKIDSKIFEVVINCIFCAIKNAAEKGEFNVHIRNYNYDTPLSKECKSKIKKVIFDCGYRIKFRTEAYDDCQYIDISWEETFGEKIKKYIYKFLLYIRNKIENY